MRWCRGALRLPAPGPPAGGRPLPGHPPPGRPLAGRPPRGTPTGAGRRQVALGLLLAELPQPVHDERGDGDDGHGRDRVPGQRDAVRDALPGTAQAVADQRDRGHPDGRADQAEDPEQQRGHLDEAGHDRHERAHHRQAPAHRHRPRAPAGEETFRPVDVGVGDEQVTAELVHQRPLTDASHRVRDEGTEQFRHRADDDHRHDAEMSLAGQDSREPERDLRRNRDAAGLEKAEEKDGGQACLAEKALHSSLLYSMQGTVPVRIGRGCESFNRRILGTGHGTAGRRRAAACGRGRGAAGGTPGGSRHSFRTRLRA